MSGAPEQSRVGERWLTAGVFAVSAAMLLGWLGHYGLWDPDEGRHSAIARELFFAESWRGWIVPSHNFTPYHDKPILYYWLVSLAYWAVGVNEVGARLVSALSALATLATLHRWMALRWDGRTARLGTLVLVTAGGFVGLGRYGSLDMLLTCWLTVGLLAAERFTASPDRTRALCMAAAAAGAGMLTKGLVAPLFIGAIPLLHALLTRRRLPLRPAPYIIALAVFLAVAGPWYAAAWAFDPAYLREFFLVHHFARFTRDATTFHAGPWWYYGPAVALLFLPWSLLLPGTLAAALARRDAATAFCLCWAGTIVVFFSASHGKLATYVLPALPPLAAVTARGLVVLGDRRTALAERLFAAGLAIIVAGLAAAAPLVPHFAGRRLPAASPTIATTLVVLPVSAIALALVWWRRGTRGTAPALVTCTLALLVLFYVRVAPFVSRHSSEKALAAVIASEPEAPIVTYQVTAASLLFYVGRPVVHANRPGPLKRLLAGQEFSWIVTSPKHVSELTHAVPAYPWETTGHHVLYGTAPRPEAPQTGAQDTRAR